MNLALGVERTLLRSSLKVMRSVVGIWVGPFGVTLLLPSVQQMQ